jgi:hypothetical protein
VLSESAPAAPADKGAEPLAAAKGIETKEVEPEDLLLELIKREYPKNLEDEHLAHIRRELEQQQSRSRVLSAFPLTNADEPAPVFRAWRRKEAGGPGRKASGGAAE